MSSAFKVFESFEGIVDRDAIYTDLEHKHSELLRFFANELAEASNWA